MTKYVDAEALYRICTFTLLSSVILIVLVSNIYMINKRKTYLDIHISFKELRMSFSPVKREYTHISRISYCVIIKKKSLSEANSKTSLRESYIYQLNIKEEVK